MKNLIKLKIKTNWPHITIIIFIAFFIIGGILIYQQWTLKKVRKDQITHNACLSENEVAYCNNCDSSDDFLGRYVGWWPSQPEITIYIRDKNTDKELFKFTISDVQTNSLSLEIHRCGVYVMRNFEFDKKEGIHKRHELWRYSYDAKGEILMNNEELYPYAKNIRIDPSENYLPLSRYYLSHPEHGIYIKNLKSPQLDNVLIIKPTDIWQKSPQLSKEREVGVGIGWSQDGKYFWGGSDGQTDYAYFRVNIYNQNKKNIEVFVMPEDAIHYGPPRVDTGYIWYVYGPPWVGFYELSEKIYEEWKMAGNKNTLFLYNLFTKEKIKLAKVDDPAWNFQPKWLSETELEYTLPTGEKKIYKIR